MMTRNILQNFRMLRKAKECKAVIAVPYERYWKLEEGELH